MLFNEFWRTLGDEEKVVFAEKCGLSQKYIAIHLVYGYKSPRLGTLQRMADASEGKLTFAELCEFFKPKSAK
ncbi:helix-turn-helix domain-containing protein [Moraxella catarrhalis]|uniref:XRE family transcriptional regulator n=1 Tax=Moraxella catarrhalis TaxID=480 RepID=A0A198UMI5_MORCA|nr:helix-turn-helix transcriptional regulator [Moraxella catarrhalis]OAU97555.1 hypothetical protein AO384_0591 [Moraxella catarrhalis]OAU98825.1 hypothetical protein AO383_0391 [Moraxella catarrhalis]OAV02916.1 hypothetical protein AO385_0761 [Moraxella catarrhalis]